MISKHPDPERLDTGSTWRDPEDAETWWSPQVHRLLDDVIELDPEARRRYWQEHAVDADQVELVESMLAAEDAPGNVLDAGLYGEGGVAAAQETWDGNEISVGDRFGVFQVHELLGEGGMGRVYRAEQLQPIRRDVALKVVHGALESQLGPRFLAERQALGRLSHPNIARLYEAGSSPDGRPFVAMELVDGEAVTAYCDRRNLGIHERLRLFVAVCRGAQHAHEKQVLHRDLKPSNILVTEVDGEACPKIIDFGIAKPLGLPFADHTLATAHGIMGTPYYMSPEALERSGSDRDLDTRSDVYSLGVVLYELLTGRRPFKTTAQELPKLLQEILNTSTPRPSRRVAELDHEDKTGVAAQRAAEPRRLVSMLAGDLDWIVGKAMARERESRYASAAELASDIERFLAGEPVEARPPSFGYRLRKWIGRHRLASGLMAITAVGLMSAAILTSLALVRAQRAEQQSRLDSQASRQALDFIVDLFQAASPDATRGKPFDAEQVVDAGVERIRESDMEPAARAEILLTLARVQTHLGRYDEAVELAEESLNMREQLSAAADPAVNDPSTWSALDVAAVALRRAGRGEEAEPLLDRLVAAVRQDGEPLRLASALNSRGNLYWSLKRFDAAEADHREALALRIEVLGDEALDVASSHNNLAALLLTTSRYRQAEPHCLKAAALLEKHLGENHPNTAHALNNLGYVQQYLERFSAALETQKKVLKIRTEVLGPEHPSTSATHNNLASLLLQMGRGEEALGQARIALALRQKAWGPDHPEILKAAMHVVKALNFLGRSPEAEDMAHDVLRRRLRLFGADDSAVGLSRRELGILFGKTGRLDDARSELESALQILAGHFGDGHRAVTETRLHLARVESAAGKLDRAAGLLGQVVDTCRGAELPCRRLLAEALTELAALADQRGHVEERDAMQNEAAAIRRRLFSPEPS